MSGWGELIKQGLKSAGKAAVQKGSTVSSKKIQNGIVEKVNPYAKTVTIQSKDGKMRETVRADEVTVQPVRRRTREESLYISDEAYTPKRISDFSESDLANMSEGEIRQRLIRDPNMQSYQDLAKAAPGDSDIMKRIRFIGQNRVPGLRKTAEDRGKFAEARAQAKQEAEAKKIAEERIAQKERFKASKQKEDIQKRRAMPKFGDPVFGGDVQKFLAARKKYEENSVKPALKNDPNATYWNRGGSVNLKKKQYKTVINKFSDRMLPGKKRTTRIY